MPLTDSNDERDPLARAIAIHHRYLRGEGPQNVDELLAEHSDLAELLQPMLAGADDEEARDPDASDDVVQLRDFRILGELGRGGMGVVYEAEERALGRRVALKVLPQTARLDPKALARFRRGSQLAAGLDHPGITKILAVGREGDQDFFTMDLVRGETLAAILEQARDSAGRTGDVTQVLLPGPRTQLVDFAIDLAVQIADALHHAHIAGVVHRDVKPANILVKADGTAVLTDFGIARATDELAVTLSGDGEFAGTVAYAAPEQHLGARGNVDHRADIWSLGATLYEILTLERPFSAATYSEIRTLIDRVDPPAPSRLNSRIPRDLDAVLLHALEKDPAQRYPTAAELADHLRKVRDGLPVPVRPIGRAQRAIRWCNRNPIAAVLLGTIAASLVVVSLLAQVANANANESADRLVKFKSVKIGRDVGILQNALNRAPGPLPENIGEIQRVVDMARALTRQLPDLRATLAGLRNGGAPTSSPNASRFLTRHPAESRLAWSRRAHAAMAFRLQQRVEEGHATPDWQRHVQDRLAGIAREIDHHEERIAERRQFSFEDPTTEYLHDTLEDQIANLEWLQERHIPALERRLALARTRADKGNRHLSEWQSAQRLADAEPRYRGLVLEARPDLLPLGRDPESGLLEFAHLGSGTPATRAADSTIEITGDTGLVFILIPGGHAEIGCRYPPPERGKRPHPLRGSQDEYPTRAVELEPFYLSKFELTHGQWNRLAEGLDVHHEASRFEGRQGFEDKPIARVTWTACERLCHAHGFVLPTEAQWEYACRAGTPTAWWCGEDWQQLLEHEHVHRRAPRGRVPVGATSPNPFGLVAMHGNVQEWCRDEYVMRGGTTRPGDGLRTGSVDGFTRSIRGAHYDQAAGYARSAKRDTAPPAFDRNTLGLRPAISMGRRQ